MGDYMGVENRVKREPCAHMRLSTASGASATTCGSDKSNVMGNLSTLSNGLSVEVQGACSTLSRAC